MPVATVPSAQTLTELTPVTVPPKRYQIQIQESSVLALSPVTWTMTVLEMPFAINRNGACVRNLMLEMTADVITKQTCYNLV